MIKIDFGTYSECTRCSFFQRCSSRLFAKIGSKGPSWSLHTNKVTVFFIVADLKKLNHIYAAEKLQF